MQKLNVAIVGDHHYMIMAVWPNSKDFDVHEPAAYTRQFRAVAGVPGGGLTFTNSGCTSRFDQQNFLCLHPISIGYRKSVCSVPLEVTANWKG